MLKLLPAFLLITILWSGDSFCQNTQIDSLISIIVDAKIDFKNKTETMILLSWKLRNSNPKLSLEYAKKALSLSTKSNLPNLTAKSFNSIGLYHMYKGNHDSSLYYFHKSINVAKNNNLAFDQASAQLNIGNIFYLQASYMASLTYYNIADSLYKEVDSLSSIAKTQANIGLIKSKLGYYSNALDHYFEALKTYSKQNNRGLISLYNNIGDVYFQLRDYDNTLYYYHKSINQNENPIDKRRLCSTLRMVGYTYYEAVKYDSALLYLTKALPLAETLNDPIALVKTLIGIAKAKYKLNALDQAKKHLNSCFELLQLNRNDDVLAEAYFLSGSIAYYEKELKKAKKELEYSLDLANIVDSKALKIKIYQKLASLYDELDQDQKAIHYLNLSLAAKDSVFNDNIFKTIATQAKYETEKKEKENASYVLKNLELEKEVEKSKFIKTVYIAIIIIVLGLASVWLYYQRAKQKTLRTINLMNEEINKQKIHTLIKNQENESIRGKIEGQENERKRLAQELHDGLGGMLASFKLHLTQLSTTQNADEVNHLISKVDFAYDELRAISRNMVPPTLLNNSFTQLIYTYLDSINIKDNLEIEVNCYPEEELNAISDDMKTDIYRIIQELTTNIIKHAKASFISVQLMKHDHYINLIVEDNGVGFNETTQRTGIGLTNISSRIKSLCGNFEITSEQEKGTIINIDIPENILIDV